MNILTGSLVRLTPSRLKEDPPILARWEPDAQYRRLFDSDPPRLHTEAAIAKEMEEEGLPDGKGFGFCLRTLADDKLIGVCWLGANWVHRDAWLAIGMGERDFWGKGYGTDGMRVLLRFAFQELQLHRVTLNTFGNNVRAIRSYEKAGFRHEGRVREAMLRDGQRIDFVQMGILRTEWLAQQADGGLDA